MKTKILSLLLCAVMLMSLCACATVTPDDGETTITEAPQQPSDSDSHETTAAKDAGVWADATYTEDTELGDGAKTVKVLVIAEERTVTFTIKTDAETLGEALISNSLAEGEDGAYGLYIKKVNGISADYDVDGYYWGLTKKGEYVMSGADTTDIEDGEQYELTRTK